ncbi:hypothetical protein T36_2218 (plasmid) [Helicobacter cinaedi]|uniref:hypothetical protein n=1 Tax=Helicobacter cinaedi TaxID=213 RepID=UPI001F1AFB07|nr:hypothetical protein [Helicobacter cinaedi]BDB65739.1 hypothetical protein T36_2218 [Helicobacter cinaedi]
MGNIHTPQKKEYSKYVEKLTDFFIDVTNTKYGGFLDITTALKLVDDLKMETSLAEQINNLQDETRDYLSDIDPVAVVLNNATSIAENELSNLGILVNFIVEGSYFNTYVSLSNIDKKSLIEALEFDFEILDNLSAPTAKILDYADCGIEYLKSSINERQQEENNSTKTRNKR